MTRDFDIVVLRQAESNVCTHTYGYTSVLRTYLHTYTAVPTEYKVWSNSA
jgi:hypothetical protein